MTTVIQFPDFQPTDPTPPPPSAADVRHANQQAREQQAAIWHSQLPYTVRRSLPAVIPFHLTHEDIARRLAGEPPRFIGKRGAGTQFDIDAMVLGKLQAMDARKQQRRIA